MESVEHEFHHGLESVQHVLESVQHELESVQYELESINSKCETNEKLIEREQEILLRALRLLNFGIFSMGHLEKTKLSGSSCSYIASMGNLESGTFLLDTDGKGNQAPYEVRTLRCRISVLPAYYFLKIFLPTRSYLDLHGY